VINSADLLADLITESVRNRSIPPQVDRPANGNES
jgi:hypothetical protein